MEPSCTMTNRIEDLTGANVLGHFHRLQEAEERRSILHSGPKTSQDMTDKVQSQDKKGQMKNETPLQTPRGADSQPLQAILSHDPVSQHSGDSISRSSNPSNDTKMMHQIRERRDKIAFEGPMSPKNMANTNNSTPASIESLDSPENGILYSCPCDSYIASHLQHSMECEMFKCALTEKSINSSEVLPNEAHCAGIRQRLEHPRFKKLKKYCLGIGWIQEAPKDSLSNACFSQRSEELSNEVCDSLINTSGKGAISIGISASEVLLRAREMELENRNLLKVIESFSIGPPAISFESETIPSDAASGIAGWISHSPYMGLSSSESDSNSAGDSSICSESTITTEFDEPHYTAQESYTGPSKQLNSTCIQRPYLRSVRINLPSIQDDEGEGQFDAEKIRPEAYSSLSRYHVGDYLEDTLLRNDCDLTSTCPGNNDCCDDNLELIDSNCGLLVPSGTRLSSTVQFKKNNDKLPVPQLIEQLKILEKEREKRVRSFVTRFLRRRRSWSDNAKFYERDCNSVETITVSNIEITKKGIFNLKRFKRYAASRTNREG